jgi:hypothetical protein
VKLLREPLVHFTAVGAVIYLLYGVFAGIVPKEDDKTILVTVAD